MNLVPGTLWRALLATEQRALASGALKTASTRSESIEDGNVRFSIRVLAALSRKDEARKAQDAVAASGMPVNPFLPPERELVVADITDTHLAVLNKFNVVPHHLLIITRGFEEQDALLTLRDFDALRLCMAEYEGIGFYNGGKEAGASQQHKHLQFVPLPLDKGGFPVPIEPLLEDVRPGVIGSVPGFSFSHAFVRFERTLMAAPDATRRLFDLYAALLNTVGMTPPSPADTVRQSGPYCFLITRGWMLLVPRSREYFEDISLNALAFAGSLFVRNEQQLERLKTAGPMQALKQVTR